MNFIRSTIFNFAFFGLTALMAFITLPATWMKRSTAMKIVRLWVRLVYALERHILHLDYEVRGWHNVPQGQSFLLAAKHESAYETFKMHILFDDPAIVLKKELTRVPLWGAFIRKSDPLAIDRSTQKKAIKSLLSELDRVRLQNRPIIVFPQGTRVRPETTTEEKPYKTGIVRMQEASGLPIVPMALNSGCFWPKMSWVKRPGTVVFEFLPAIEVGQEDVLSLLQSQLESASAKLILSPHRGEG